jgi:hypothetical protein
MDARNNKIQNVLTQKYGTTIPSARFMVFCIENVMYSEHDDRHRKLRGIPALREHLQDLRAEPLFKASNLLLAKQIPALLNSFSRFVQMPRIDMKLENRVPLTGLDELRVSLDDVIDWSEKLKTTFEQCIDKPLAQNTHAIRAACISVARAWGSGLPVPQAHRLGTRALTEVVRRVRAAGTRSFSSVSVTLLWVKHGRTLLSKRRPYSMASSAGCHNRGQATRADVNIATP